MLGQQPAIPATCGTALVQRRREIHRLAANDGGACSRAYGTTVAGRVDLERVARRDQLSLVEHFEAVQWTHEAAALGADHVDGMQQDLAWRLDRHQDSVDQSEVRQKAKGHVLSQVG